MIDRMINFSAFLSNVHKSKVPKHLMASCVFQLWAGKLLGNMQSLLSPFSADFKPACGFERADYQEPKEICALLPTLS